MYETFVPVFRLIVIPHRDLVDVAGYALGIDMYVVQRQSAVQITVHLSGPPGTFNNLSKRNLCLGQARKASIHSVLSLILFQRRT